MKKDKFREIAKPIMGIIAFAAMLGLIIFAVIYNTIKNQLMDKWYWGLIGALVAGVVISIKWFFFGGKKENGK